MTVAALGWLFDTMDQNLFTMVRSPSLTSILRSEHTADKLPDSVKLEIRLREREAFLKENPAAADDQTAIKKREDAALEAKAKSELDAEVKEKSGWITSIFIIGWATGGFIFGILGDRLGRTRTMIITIAVYAVFTGFSGLVHSFWPYCFTRFMTGLGVGGEWAAGAALIAETFPARSRPMALGLLQALSTVGNMTAAVVTAIIGDLSGDHWRIAYFIGAAPALLVVWIQKSVHEPEAWTKAKEHKTAAKEMGSIVHLFRHPVLRRHTIAASLMATAGVGALWGVAFFSPDMVRNELLKSGLTQTQIGRIASATFFFQQIGSFFGIYLFAIAAEKFGRKPVFALWFVLAWLSILAFFWKLQGSGSSAVWWAIILATVMGFCTLGPFCGYSIYFPELFPTSVRTTGCGFCYNVARYLAAFAPFALGGLAKVMGGYAPAASVVSCVFLLGFVGLMIGPETKGKPLPEDSDFQYGAELIPVAPLAHSDPTSTSVGPD